MDFGFYVYLVFIVSWFTHLTSRIPALGAIRFDLLLIITLFIAGFLSFKNQENAEAQPPSLTTKVLKIIFIYIVLTLPFVYWPGSVISHGIEAYIKAIVFFYFTIVFVTSEKKLKIFIIIFLASQTFRILEPLYLHITQGYWGSFASMADWELMNRLSGAPFDVVNPNGLAFIVLTVVPFYYFLSNVSIVFKLICYSLIPAAIYTLVLTGSRSGVLGLFVIFIGIIIKSKHKLVLLLIIGVACVISFGALDDNFKDRYFSIFSSHTKNAATAQGRNDGVKKNFEVALKRPLFGFGLGTSREVNANFLGRDQPAHNLYAEVAQELGFVGLGIFVVFIVSIVINFAANQKLIKDKISSNPYWTNLNSAMQVWLFMNILFSFASFGLSSYEWYLFAGLSIVTNKLIINMDHAITEAI